MLAELDDGAGLRAGGALILGDDQPDLVACHERLEAAAGDAVLVKIDLEPVRGLDEAVVREQPRYLAVRRRVMRLHIAAQAAAVILEPPSYRGEGIADRHIHVLMGMIERMAMAGDQLLAGCAEVDADAVEPALALVPVSLLD